MKNAFEIVKDFEFAVAEYTGAPYCVAVNSCTNALFLALKWHDKKIGNQTFWATEIEIPKHTYVSVPMQIMHAGYTVRFRDEAWRGAYLLKPFNIWDSARRFYYDMFYDHSRNKPNVYMCTSHHWTKRLGLSQGGCILHNNSEFDIWARKARFDGRTEGVSPKDDKFNMMGYHMYMSPEIAAHGLVKLMHLPKYNDDLPNDDYPDLSTLEIFK